MLPVSDAFGTSSVASFTCLRYAVGGDMTTLDVNYYNGAVYTVINVPGVPVSQPVIARIYLRQKYVTNGIVYGAASASGNN